jgi:thymidylate synthase (FAD)
VLEHAVFSLIITGVSRSLSHELVRHRAGFSFSQLSQRYVDESDCAFVVPPALEDEVRTFFKYPDGDYPKRVESQWWAGEKWHAAAEFAVEQYELFSAYLSGKYAHIEDRTARRKMAREAARSVLPNAAETKLFVTSNVRALRHFIELRANPAADAEIRRVAVAVCRLMKIEAPNLFGDYVVDVEGETVSTPHRKV